MKPITLTGNDVVTIRRMVMAYRDKRETELEQRIAYGGKYADPEIQYIQSEIKEAKRIIKLLFRKEAESENGWLNSV
nr:MAG TPA: hypothetical protein [Caudoviricetes sp.]